MKRFFASDNCSTAHPAILEAMAGLETSHVHSYGDDPVTRDALSFFEDLFDSEAARARGRRALTSFVFTGTAANVIALSTVLYPGQGVICCAEAHINTDEGGAAELLGGWKLLTVTGRNAKLRPEDIAAAAANLGNQHKAQPAMVSISQSTELGSLYTVDEIRALCEAAHAWNLPVHLDGSRLSQAVAAMVEGEGLAHGPHRAARARELLCAMTVDAGVDLLSLGGTKNGLVGAEGLVLFVPSGPAGSVLDQTMQRAGERLPFVHKGFMQLGSKMRYLACQMHSLHKTELWLDNALNARTMALRLARGLAAIPGVELAGPVEANAVFVKVPASMIQPLQDFAYFYVWDESIPSIRLMCGWDTQSGDVDALLAKMADLAGGHAQ